MEIFQTNLTVLKQLSPLHTAGLTEKGECTFTEWSDFGPCSVTCGGVGEKVRVRRLISVGDDADFLNCTGALNEIEPCTGGNCSSKAFCGVASVRQIIRRGRAPPERRVRTNLHGF